MRFRIIKNSRPLLTLFILIPALIVTLAAVSQPQRITQFAQETFSDPPLYGCLKVGEGNNSDCASKLGISTAFTLTLHGKPVEKEAVVYYGDRLEGTVKFTNVGDLPLNLTSIGLAAQSEDKKTTRDFTPITGKTTLPPRESVDIKKASYLFKSPDSNTNWTISTKIKTSGGEIPTTDIKKKITVNATCTALRRQELTEKDKKNLQTHCGRNPKSRLCTSRQYCEIFKGANCTQQNVSQETPGWQCDPGVYLPKTEQDLLEELCKVYPDTDACKNFCDRTYDSSLCPQKYLFVDTKTGKTIKFKHPRAFYVLEPDNYYFEYADNYPAAKTKMSPPNPSGTPPKPSTTPPRTLGIQDNTNSRLLALAGPGDRPGMNSVPPPPNIRAPGRNSAGAGYVPGQGTSMRPAKPPAITRRAAPPPRRSEPMGSQPRDPAVERNNQRPNPAKGRFYDPSNPNGSLTLAQTAEFGDFGYAPHCGSGRGDANPVDDPAGAPQAACCASSVALREGCCNGQCTVWSQKSKDGKLRDGNGNVCTNDPALARQTNTCSFERDKEAVRRQIIPPDLQGQGQIDPPKPAPNQQAAQGAPGSSAPPGGPQFTNPVNRGPQLDEGAVCALHEDCVTGFCSQQRGCTQAPPAVAPGQPNYAGYNECIGPEPIVAQRTKCQNDCSNNNRFDILGILGTTARCSQGCRDTFSQKETTCKRTNNIP